MSLSICWFIFMSRFLDIVIFLDQSPFAPPCVPILDEGTLLSRFFCCTLGWPPQTSYFHYTVAKIGPAKGLDAAPQGRPGKAIFFYSTCAFLQWWLSFIMRHCHYHTTLSSSIVFFWLCLSQWQTVCPRQVQKWSAHDLNECKRICTGKCQAVQWVPSSHLCELWNVPVVHSMSQQGAECYAKSADATKISDALMPKERSVRKPP